MRLEHRGMTPSLIYLNHSKRTRDIVLPGLVHRGCVLYVVVGVDGASVSRCTPHAPTMSSTHTHGPERHPQIPTQSPTYTDSTRFRFHDSQRQNHSWSKMPVQLVGLSSTLVLWPPLPLALWLTSCAPGTVGGGRKEAMPPALSALASDGDAAAAGVGVGGTAAAGCGVDCPAPMAAACWVCR